MVASPGSPTGRNPSCWRYPRVCCGKREKADEEHLSLPPRRNNAKVNGARAVLGSQRVRRQRRPGIDLTVVPREWLLRAEDGSRSGDETEQNFVRARGNNSLSFRR